MLCRPGLPPCSFPPLFWWSRHLLPIALPPANQGEHFMSAKAPRSARSHSHSHTSSIMAVCKLCTLLDQQYTYSSLPACTLLTTPSLIPTMATECTASLCMLAVWRSTHLQSQPRRQFHRQNLPSCRQPPRLYQHLPHCLPWVGPSHLSQPLRSPAMMMKLLNSGAGAWPCSMTKIWHRLLS